MSFVFKKGNQYSWPVKIDVPIDGGKHEQMKFEAIFKLIKQSELRALLGMGESDKTASDLVFCETVMVGWKGVVDESQNPIEFSKETLAEMAEFPGFAKAIVVAYLESMAGAKAKNS